MNNIYLCGFAGCGKAALGKLVAKQTGGRFIDLDRFIEKRVGCRPEDFLKQSGGEAFRCLEAAAFEEVCLMHDAVVAVGGSTFDYEHNIVAAKNSGKVIYLFVPFAACYRRIKSSRVNLYGLDEQTLFEIYNKRHTIYKISSNNIYEPLYPPEYCAKQLAKL